MSNVEGLTAAIVAKGDEIRVMKAAKATKEEMTPLINELLALKISYKAETGMEYGAAEKPAKVEAPKREGPSERELAKEKRKAEKAAKQAVLTASSAPVQDVDPELAKLFGDYPLIQSKVMTEKAYRDIEDLGPDYVGQTIWLRGRLANSRAVGKGCFLLLRQTLYSIQAIMFQGTSVPKAMVKYATGISLESVIDICAVVTVPESPVSGATVKGLELNVTELHVVSRARELPFNIDDAGRSEADAEATGLPVVGQDLALDFRWVDTRTPANQAIFRIQSASEGGANVFKFDYFGRPACLAQSPQFYKQMVSACGGFDRVFEIGPVFRAENSNTHRHLCEFTGLDFEMAIYEHYYEALDVMGEMFNYIFDGLNERFGHELMLISQQYPFEPLKYLRPPLRITFQEGITMLRESGVDASYDDDISTPHEKALGKLVAEKYNTDFYIMDKYPLSVRPFYTMPDPENPKLSNSYDLFIRGEEIVSGAQRVHDVDLLIQRAQEFNIPIQTIQSYIDAFKHGVQPHAGGGVGMERVVMLFLGLKNIRKSSMFPRDPVRLMP